ncbi:MAG: lasso peptide biosynthesis B2 protein [Chloroflexota bacterium]
MNVTPGHRLRRGLHLARRIARLSPSEYLLIVRAYVWLTGMSLALRIVGFRQIMAMGDHRAGTARGSRHSTEPIIANRSVNPSEMDRALRYARWINAASHRHFVRGQCLHRSLVLYFWLQQERVPSEFQIGVRKAGPELLAHAWVTLGDRCISDTDEPGRRFIPILNVGSEYPAWVTGLKYPGV